MAKKNSSDKAKKAINSGYQVKEDKPTKAKGKQESKKKSSSKPKNLKANAKVNLPKPKKDGSKKPSGNKSPSTGKSAPTKPIVGQTLPTTKTATTPKSEPNIRWMKRDNAKVAQAVRRANAKASRLNKKGFDIPKISVKEVKKNFTTRKEFNKFLKDVDKFVERGSEKGKKREDIWDYEKTYHLARHNRREAIKAKQLEEYMNEDVFSRGQNKGKRKDQTIKSRFMESHENTLKPTKFDVSSRSNFNKMTRSIDRFFDPKFNRSKDETHKNNLIVAVLGDLKDEQLAKMIALLPADKIAEMARRDSEFNIDFVYDKFDMQIRIDAIKTIIEDEFEKMRERKIRELKRKGTPEDVLETIENLDNEAYATNFVEDLDTFDRADPLGLKHTFAKYTITDDITEIKRKFGIS